jgi:hypothetical protein
VKPTSKNLQKLVILDSVQANDRNYLVTEVKAGAGRGMKKLTTLTVGVGRRGQGNPAHPVGGPGSPVPSGPSVPTGRDPEH